MKDPKFKIGEEVKCIKHPQLKTYGGAGWKQDRVFKIDKITPYESGEGRSYIYWGSPNGGVYEPFLELNAVTNWRKRLQQ